MRTNLSDLVFSAHAIGSFAGFSLTLFVHFAIIEQEAFLCISVVQIIKQEEK